MRVSSKDGQGGSPIQARTRFAIDGEPAGGTVTALERVDLLVIRSEKLTDALAGHPEAVYELYRAIARSLAGRLRRAVSMLAFARERGVAR